jgi:hypothetical protein
MLSLLLIVPNIVVCPLSRGFLGRSRGVGDIIIIADAKDKLVCVYKVGEVLVRC